MSEPARLVWDLPLRVFHWLLVASFLASWITGLVGYDLRGGHMVLGYWMIGLLVFRAAWGIVGTRHARFTSFLPTPSELRAHARDLLRGKAMESAGHDPLGSLMVYVLLLLLAAQAVSGLFIDDDIMYAGPYNGAVSGQLVGLMSDLHHSAADIIVVLVAIHVLAVCYYTVVRRRPLIRAMFTGRKPAEVVPGSEAITGSRLWLAFVVALAAAVFVYWLVAIAPPS